jgi:hypothetical protein
MTGQSEHSHEERVRLKAYEIWLNEGKPEGRDARHWEMAREIIGYEDARQSTLQPSTGAPGPVEPTVAFESLGDVPELTDLGDGQRGPRRGTKAAAPLATTAAAPKKASRVSAPKGTDSGSAAPGATAASTAAPKASKPRAPRKTT